MKTTIDLPDALLRRAKITAAERSATLKDLVVTGLEMVLQPAPTPAQRKEAIRRMRKGLVFKRKPLKREDLHERD